MKYQKGQKILSAIALSATLLITSGSVLADDSNNKVMPVGSKAEPTSNPTDSTGASNTLSTSTKAESTSTTYADSTSTNSAEPISNADPYEGFNRPMFAFNDALDKYVLKPVATFYNTIMPTPLNQGIHNVFLNFGNLPNIANDLLQFHFYQAANDSWRLVINTTVGVGGLFDIAGRINLKPYVNDFGMTLATWGFKQSNYLVLPFFGSHTVRDTVGLPVDYYAFSIYPYITPDSTQYGVYALSIIDNRAQLLKYQDVMEAAAVDRYAFIRNAYIQKRTFQIEENKHRGYEDQLNNRANTAVVAATAGDAADYTATPSE